MFSVDTPPAKCQFRYALHRAYVLEIRSFISVRLYNRPAHPNLPPSLIILVVVYPDTRFLIREIHKVFQATTRFCCSQLCST